MSRYVIGSWAVSIRGEQPRGGLQAAADSEGTGETLYGQVQYVLVINIMN